MIEAPHPFLVSAGTIKAPAKRLRNLATDTAQAEWEAGHWQRQEAAQAVFDSCQHLLEAIEHAERVFARELAKPTKRK